MKLYYFTLSYVVFFIVAVIYTDISIGKMKAIEKEQSTLTTILNSATSDAIEYLATTGTTGAGSIHKEEVVDIFFNSLYSSMGIMSDFAAQRELDLYIPLILLCDVDGYYIYYYDEYRSLDGTILTEHMWSEKMVYHYEDANFIYRLTLSDEIYIYDDEHLLGSSEKVIKGNISEIQESSDYSLFRAKYPDNFMLNDENYELMRRSIIMEQLETTMTYFVNQHNFIASRNGIKYDFAFPNTSKEWASNIDDVNLIVVFQGYPYMNSRDYTFNKIEAAGANVIKKTVYYVEEKSWYKLAHVKGCEKLMDNPNILEEVFESKESYVAIGAYSCECIDHGARVPTLK